MKFLVSFLIVCHMEPGRRVVRTQIYRIGALFTESHRSVNSASSIAVGGSGPYLPSRDVVLKSAVFLAQLLADALHSRQPFTSRIQLLNCLFFHKERPLQVFDLYLKPMLLLL